MRRVVVGWDDGRGGGDGVSRNGSWNGGHGGALFTV